MYELHPYQKKLVQQTRKELANGKNSVLIQSPAGSGKSVIIAEIARLTVKKGGYVLFMVHRKELVEQITDSFKENNVDLSHCTIMTVGRVKNRLGKLPKPTLIITDETHHSLAKTYRNVYKFYLTTPRIGFSATPWRMNGKGLHDVYESMVKGPSVKWLINNKYLAPFKYYSVNLVNSDKLKKSSTGDYTNKSMDEAVGKTIFGDVINTYKKVANGQQAIVYAHSVEYSQIVADSFNQAGISARHVDAKTPSTKREQIMTDFKAGKIKIICNVDLISEGFNVPDCSTIILLRPTASLVLFIQQSMRSMRYKSGKVATIIDHVANYSRFGLPDDDFGWTLDDREKKKSGRKDDAPAIKTCDRCFRVVPAQSKICPFCGFEFEVEATEMQEDKNAKIEKIGEFKMVADYKNIKYGKMKASDAKNPEELFTIAKARKYKPGWAYMQAKRRGMLG
ncbi:DEAD/DEAH box helicase [Pediococcus ethanolidurans]|uniref:DEAD/DEAH box helicase n=1 Tax=Pediococcus ethanolidurans TaxID=319653 RepID=UPI001C1EF509|nr:DEAD/DEAH box helicase [Pediococcus ethanolidurans]MBU7554463.1 DEAD/DEAH box helicase family protein [Pediococcus ethanolidurans]